MAPAVKGRDKLTFDTHLLEVYLTGLQSEVEAKLRLAGSGLAGLLADTRGCDVASTKRV